jgi:hypothetical protein
MNLGLLLSDQSLLIACAINVLVNVVTTTTGAARIAGVMTRRIATSMSLYNFFFLFARMANLLYTPFLGSIVDRAATSGDFHVLEIKLRFIIVAATLGNILGWLLLPTFIVIYNRGVQSIEKNGSLPMVLLKLLNPRNMLSFFASFRLPSMLGLRNFSLKDMPRSFLVLNVFMTAIWAIGVLCSIYASVLIPSLVRTATLLSGLVNGIATILFSIFVDPTAALITDQAAAGIRKEEQVRIMVFYLTMGNILGTIISQFFFLPGAEWIAFVTGLFGH